MSSGKKKGAVKVITNRLFSKEDDFFKRACKIAGVEPTVRQASKFRLGRGLAFKNRKRVESEKGEG